MLPTYLESTSSGLLPFCCCSCSRFSLSAASFCIRLNSCCSRYFCRSIFSLALFLNAWNESIADFGLGAAEGVPPLDAGLEPGVPTGAIDPADDGFPPPIWCPELLLPLLLLVPLLPFAAPDPPPVTFPTPVPLAPGAMGPLEDILVGTELAGLLPVPTVPFGFIALALLFWGELEARLDQPLAFFKSPVFPPSLLLNA